MLRLWRKKATTTKTKAQIGEADFRELYASLVGDMIFSYTILLYVILNLETRNKRANRASAITLRKVEANKTPNVEEVRADMADMKVESRPVELLTSVGSCTAV